MEQHLGMIHRIKLVTHMANIKVWHLFLFSLPAFFWPFVDKYLTGDVGYIKWLGVAMTIDLLTGMAKAWKMGGTYKAITSRGIRDTVSKAISYGALIIITHIVIHFEVAGQEVNQTFSWADKLACEFLMIIEGKSIYENIIIISPNLDFVKFMVDKITTYLKKKE